MLIARRDQATEVLLAGKESSIWPRPSLNTLLLLQWGEDRAVREDSVSERIFVSVVLLSGRRASREQCRKLTGNLMLMLATSQPEALMLGSKAVHSH